MNANNKKYNKYIQHTEFGQVEITILQLVRHVLCNIFTTVIV
jgi:hypothetical protein